MIVTARNLQMPVTLELQKTNRRIPVAHISSCELLTGSVSAQLTDAGILTDMINLRYANELNMKARTLVESTLCDNMNRMIASQINTKLRHFPLLLNIFEVLKYLDNVKQRYSRNTFEQPSDIRWQRSLPGQTYSTATDESSVFHRNLTQIFDFNKLKNINLYLDIIDTSSSTSDYIIGLDGKADLIDSSHAIPNTFISSNAPLNFPQNIRPKMLDVILSDSVLNDLLHQLWRGGAFVVKIDKRFPEFGHILKTSCSLDEVCISDSIPEVGENFPDQYLTITTSLIKSPIAVIKPHHIVLTLEGVSLFLVENNGKEVGQIPFIATILLELKMVENNSKVKLSLSVPKLEIKESVSFLGLKAEYLTSLKNGAVNVIQKFVNEKLSKGVDFQPFTSHLAQEFGVYYPVITLLDDGQILFQSDLDIQKLYYSPHFFN
uniref:BPI2 domain-containing protein n=1 Tax=Rhabditophanes sp. KR3021 TaxID=114890 RepID=A0AC35TQ72_9BILA